MRYDSYGKYALQNVIKLFLPKVKFLSDDSKAKLYFYISFPYLSVDYMLIICKSLGNLDVLSHKNHVRNSNQVVGTEGKNLHVLDCT